MKTYNCTVTPGEMDWEVTVDGSPLNPRYDLRNHSPDGFSHGYSGSGPAQLSLALLADVLKDDDKAQQLYQDFKSAIIAQLPMDEGWTMTEQEILEHVKRLEKRLSSR